MNFIKSIDIIFIFAFSLLIVYDFFPNTPFADFIPSGVLIPLILVIMLVSLIFKKYRETNKKVLFKWQIFMMIYIILLIGTMTILGGQSSTGIAFDNEVMWIVFLMSLFSMYSQWKKLRNSEE